MWKGRELRLLTLMAGVALLLGSSAIGLIGGRTQAEAQLDEALAAAAVENAAVIEEYFERARMVDLLLAQNPVFAAQYVPRGRGGLGPLGHRGHGLLGVGAHRGPVHDVDAVNDALAYIEQLYPGRIGEACLIDRNGVETARVVNGVAAPHHDLSAEEGDNAFFQETVRLGPGRVHQALPYRSPDTGEWVISNSTMLPWAEGPSPALVHFEVTVDSFREEAERRAGRFDLLIVDGRSGAIVSRTGHAQQADQPLGAAATPLTRAVVATGTTGGATTVDGVRVAYRRIDTGADNANDWFVAARSSELPAAWSTMVGKAALASGGGALLLVVLSLLSLRSSQRELRHSAETDPLTGLPNRARFSQFLGDRLRGADGARSPLAVLLLDLDGFKEVNDTLGHPAGDRLLQQVAERLEGSLRTGDLIARLGGDEFAVVLDADRGPAGVLEAADRLLAALRRPYVLDGVGVHVDASIGVTLAPEHGDTAELLVQRADVAMYQAKRTNAGVVTYAPDSDPHDTRRLQLVAGLLEAIEQRELRLHYQPKLDVAEGRVIGVEALVRWQHPVLGELSPAEFIPVAESTGLIRPLTLCVLDLALAQCRRWQTQGRHLPVAVNCSALDLLDRRLPQEVARLLVEHDVRPEMLRLELTETMVMSDPERAASVLRELHEMGVALAIDDFGTGYSSLAYLRQLPLDELKIDRAFVARMVGDTADAFIVASMIDLGHNLGLTVVAEGVEDAATLDQLGSLDCDVAQGFHLSRPLTPHDLEAWLDRRHPPGASDPDPGPPEGAAAPGPVAGTR